MNQRIAVLFVDDDEIFLKVLGKYFQIQHPQVRVKTCRSGEECLEALPDFQPDLIVLDYYLQSKDASMQGIRLLQTIHTRDTHAKIVVLSGREREQMIPELAKENVEDYIVKDMNALPELDKVLEKYWGS